MKQDGTTILFGLTGLRVVEVVRVAGGARVVQVMTAPEAVPAASACPLSVRQRRITRPRDLPLGEEPGSRSIPWGQQVQATNEVSYGLERNRIVSLQSHRSLRI